MMAALEQVPSRRADVAPRTAVTFTVPGRLPGWQRAGIQHRTGRIYTPRQTESAEGMVRWYAVQAMAGRVLLVGPVRLVVAVFLRMPESWSKKKKASTRYATGKPDVDNLLKLVADSCSSTIYKDDSQIAQALITRRYVPQDMPERVDIRIRPLSEAPA